MTCQTKLFLLPPPLSLSSFCSFIVFMLLLNLFSICSVSSFKKYEASIEEEDIQIESSTQSLQSLSPFKSIKVETSCLPEQSPAIKKFYLYKASAAPIVLIASIDSTIPSSIHSQTRKSQHQLTNHGTTFLISQPEFLKGADVLSEQEVAILRNLFGDGKLYINLTKSLCNEMKHFDYFILNQKFIFYLSKSRDPDNSSFLERTNQTVSSSVSVPTLTFFAQPDPYKAKLETRIREDIFCVHCIDVAPYLIRKWPSSFYLREGETFSLSCKAGGSPLPHNFMSYNHSELKPSASRNSRSSLIAKGRKLTLSIERVQVSDSGIYGCTGTNFVDRDVTMETHLHVSPGHSTTTAPGVNTSDAATETTNEFECPPKYEHFCLNGGTCFWLAQEGILGCRCIGFYQGHRCQDYVITVEKLKSDEKSSPSMWAIIAFLILCLALVVLLLVVARQYFCVKKLRKEVSGQRFFQGSLMSSNRFDYEVTPVPKRAYGPREVNYNILKTLEENKNFVADPSLPRNCCNCNHSAANVTKVPIKTDETEHAVNPYLDIKTRLALLEREVLGNSTINTKNPMNRFSPHFSPSNDYRSMSGTLSQQDMNKLRNPPRLDEWKLNDLPTPRIAPPVRTMALDSLSETLPRKDIFASNRPVQSIQKDSDTFKETDIVD